jgi:hypothetical protein
MRGMSHHRTSVERGLDLIRRLTSSGEGSQAAKPMYTLMTDLGKTTLYEGSISSPTPSTSCWSEPTPREHDPALEPLVEDARIGPRTKRFLRVWYPDGRDEEQARISLVS